MRSIKEIVLSAAASLLLAYSAQTTAQTRPDQAKTDDKSAQRVTAITFKDSSPKWPEFISTGTTAVTIKWTCNKSSNPKIKVSEEMHLVETVKLADKERLSSRKFVPGAMALAVSCEVHRLQISVAGPGSIAVN